MMAFAVASLAHADFVIVNARIELGDGKVIEKGSVYVKGDRIEALGESVNAPAGTESVDATGMTVYPGFIDAYTTRGLKLPDAPAAATPPPATLTAPANMWAGNRKGIRAQVKAVDSLNFSAYVGDARVNGITMAAFFPGGATVRGSGAIAPIVEGDKLTGKEFGMEISFRSGSGQGFPGSLMGVVSLLRQTLHDAQRQSQLANPTKDADLDALVPLLKGQQPAVVFADTDVEILRALRLGEEFGFKVIIASGREGQKRAEQLAKAKIPVLAGISTGVEPGVTPANDGPPKEVLEERRENWRVRSQNIVKMIEAGVPVAFSSESDGMAKYLDNVRALITLGVKREDALRAMTVTPAEIFGLTDAGALAAGKAANLVVMTGDFAKADSKVKWIVVNGTKTEVTK
jgi:imidazolonepropionase-like amidohydrolase